MLAAALALFVARPFVPAVAIAQAGYGAIFVMLWLLLLVSWILVHQSSARQAAIPPLKSRPTKAARRSSRSASGTEDAMNAGSAQSPPSCGQFAPLRFGWIDLLVLAFFCVYTVSGVVGAIRGSPRPAVNVLWHWLSVGIAYFLFRQLVRDDMMRRVAVAVMMGLAAAMAAIGLEQVVVSLPAARAAYEQHQHDPRELYDQTGQWLPEESPERELFEARLTASEPTATLALSNSLAALLIPSIGLGFGVLVQQLRASRWSLPSTTWIALVWMLLCACLFLTHSRGGVVAASCTVLAVGLLLAGRRVRLASLCVALGGLGAALWYLSKSASALRSLLFRFDYWQATWALIQDFPIFGCGPGLFQDTYTAYKLPTAGEEVADPHNFLLEIWSTGGTLAAGLFLAALLAIARHVYRARRWPQQNGRIPKKLARTPKRLWLVYGGALMGLPLGAVAAWLDSIPISATQFFLSAATFVVTLAILHRWILLGTLPCLLPAVAACGLLLHLCISGGIGEPALSSLLWLLISLELAAWAPALSHRSNERPNARPGPRFLPAPAILGVPILMIGLTIVAYVSYYRPVLSAASALARADAASIRGQIAAQLEAVEAAAAADSWSIEAARRLAVLRFASWEQAPLGSEQEAWREADASARRLAPRRHGIWRESAQRYLNAYHLTGNAVALEESLLCAARAVRLYPTHSDHQLFLAQVLLESGFADRARRALAAADRLDRGQSAAGHREKVLPAARRQILNELADRLDAEP